MQFIRMISNWPRPINAIFFLFVLLLCMACHRKSQKNPLDVLEAVLEKKLVTGPDRIWQKNCPKIITILTDTGACTTCSLQFRDWYHYKIALENEQLECDIIYVLSDSIQITPVIADLFRNYPLHYVTGAETMLRENKLSDCPFRTFLVDSLQQIKLAGSPLYNARLWNLYKKVLKGKSY